MTTSNARGLARLERERIAQQLLLHPSYYGLTRHERDSLVRLTHWKHPKGHTPFQLLTEAQQGEVLLVLYSIIYQLTQ